MELANPNPTVHTDGFIPRKECASTDDDDVRDPIDALEVVPSTWPRMSPSVVQVFDLIRDITDPEHPHSLEQLKVCCPPMLAPYSGSLV
jgi:hypothetical protein